MFSFTKSTPKTSLLLGELKPYRFGFSLSNIVPGVDNVRYDVCLSPEFCQKTDGYIFRLITEHAKAEDIVRTDSKPRAKSGAEFRIHVHKILLDAIHKAKARHEIEIDYLAQVSIAKALIRSIQEQYEAFIEQFKNTLWQYEASRSRFSAEAIKLKERLSEIQKSRKTLLGRVGQEVFKIVLAVQQKDLQKLREANFGHQATLPLNVIANPMLYAADISDDDFIIAEYDILLSHRYEDPNKYDLLLQLIRNILESLLFPDNEKPDQDVEPIIKNPDNFDVLLNYFQSEARTQNLKAKQAPKSELLSIQQLAGEQKQVLSHFFKHFIKTGLMDRITAFYEMKPVYGQYCPPLIPQQVAKFLTLPKSRKTISDQLNRLKAFYGKDFSLKPLNRLIRDIEKLSKKEKQKHLIHFVKGFSRFHRDYQNVLLLKESMDKINLATDDKIINLSRANKTLYDFMLPQEHVIEESTIIHHVIIKADVRGSTDITHHMRARGLNSASFFSLNFFDPISEILSEYGANKSFIEGDAIILSIFEHNDKPGGWYSVARACGLALRILFILRRYNNKSVADRLPVLEVGIGINYHEGAPTFLFDDEKRIMISPAINLADRMSGCNKSIRQQMAGRHKPFNLYLFQSASEAEIKTSADDVGLRYNVNGIELNPAGFQKLSQEIELKVIEGKLPGLEAEPVRLYTGKFPTLSGKYQRLLIREANIPEISDDFSIIRLTPHKYYEVCSQPTLYEHVKRKLSRPVSPVAP